MSRYLTTVLGPAGHLVAAVKLDDVGRVGAAVVPGELPGTGEAKVAAAVDVQCGSADAGGVAVVAAAHVGGGLVREEAADQGGEAQRG